MEREPDTITDEPATPTSGPTGSGLSTGSSSAGSGSAASGSTGPVALLRGVLDRPLASYYLLLAAAGMLLIIGLTMVFSATSVEAYVEHGSAYVSIEKQAISAALGLVAFWLFQRLPTTTYRSVARPALIFALVLMVALDVLALLAQSKVLHDPTFGPIRADELWLYIGPVQMQPAELAKIALVIWVADVLVRKGRAAGRWRDLSRPLFPVATLLFLLVGYNDLGTMLCLVVLFFGTLWAAGVRMRVFAGMATVALTGALLLIYMPGNTYRQARLDAFTNPDGTLAAAGYQARAGMVAIANGGWFGLGLGEGRTKWGYLPNGHNDFIFAVIAEELGVMGCLVVLGLFAVLVYTGFRIARRSTDRFRLLAAAGITTWLAGQATINIAGVIGLMPITGLPLPLISDGGSALVVTLAMIGMLASFARAEPDAARALHARPPGKLMRLLWCPLPPLPRAGAPQRAAIPQRKSGT